MLRFILLSLALAVVTYAAPSAAADCVPPRILFVVDSSSSMLGEIDDGGATTTKWQAAQDAVKKVLDKYPNAAQYGLMVFPGKAGQCSTGEVLVEPAEGTASTILQTLKDLVIPKNNQTPAGQTLMAASSYAKITDPNYANAVIFVTDGFQYCSVENDTACVTQADCNLMGVSSCPSCLPDASDGCYCVQDWSVLGAQALANKGVDTYVVGFGQSVNFLALNQTAKAGGTALAGCDPAATTPSCYYQAQNPAELTSAFGTIVSQVVTEPCSDDCGLTGEKTCTLNGWSDCHSTPQSCQSSCGTPGTQACESGQLTQCSSEKDCSASGGSGGSAASGGQSGAAGSAASGGQAGSGAGATGGASAGPDDSGDEGSCGCRSVTRRSPTGGLSALALFGLLLLRRRRRA